jgi:hypothetical protein
MEGFVMVNKTTSFKDMVNKLETLNIDQYANEDKVFSTAKTVLDGSKGFIKSAKDMKMQVKNQFEEQCKKCLNLSDEKIEKDLGVNRAEIEEIIDENREEDFEKIINVCKKIMEHEYRKASFFSEKRKQLKPCLKSLAESKKVFDEYFDMLNKMLNLVTSKIRLHQIDKGDISSLAEITNVPILLSKDEKCYIKVHEVELYEDRSVSDTVGGYSGFSFRVARGVSYRIGGFGAQSESHMEKRLIDKGIFYVTNKRYVFDGSSKNIEGDLKKVISVEAYSDGIKISRANKRDEVFAGDMDGEYIGAVISGIVKNIK